MSVLNEYLDQLSGDERLQVEAIIERFEEAWQKGQPPLIETFVQGEGAERLALLVELVQVDLERRLKAGGRVTVEAYLDKFPDLAENLHVTLRLIEAEYRLRQVREPGLSLADYQQRFPQYSFQLEDLFEELRASTEVYPVNGKAAAHVGMPPKPKKEVKIPLPPPRPRLPDPPPLRYQPQRLHASGGLGEVYEARDEELNRKVALKRIQSRHAHDQESQRRFLLEAEITGRLEHPGIVPVYGLVRTADGQPCYAMRFIQGETLHDAIKLFHEAENQPGRDPGERSLTLRHLLGRFLVVCNTIAYAHSRGILHRDIKPANVMLGKYGETLVVDWGLAKAFDRDDEVRKGSDEETLTPTSVDIEGATQHGQEMGTPGFMSPEQANGQWDIVGQPSDIFNLGATLYALLTGQAPYQGGKEEIMRKARQTEFQAPRQLKKHIPPALEAICLKAMARDPKQRYASVSALADDLEHWLADEPVSVYRESMLVRVDRWSRRHPTFAERCTWASVILLGVVSGLVLYFGFLDPNKKLEEADRQTRAAEKTARELSRRLSQEKFKNGDTATGLAYLARCLRDTPSNKEKWGQLIPETRGDLDRLRDELRKNLDERRVDIHPLKAILDQTPIVAGNFNKTGNLVLVASQDGTIQFWKLDGDSHHGPVRLGLERPILALALRSDQNSVVTLNRDGVQAWNAYTGAAQGELLTLEGGVQLGAFSADAQTVLVVFRNGTVQCWELATGKKLGQAWTVPGKVEAVAFHPDARQAVTVTKDMKTNRTVVQRWELDTGKENAQPFAADASEVKAVALSSNGQWVLTGSADGTACLWEVDTGRLTGSPMRHQGDVRVVAFGRDDKTFLTGSHFQVEKEEAKGKARLWQRAHAMKSGPPVTTKRPLEAWEQAERLMLTTKVLTGLEVDDKEELGYLDRDKLEGYRKRLKVLDEPGGSL